MDDYTALCKLKKREAEKKAKEAEAKRLIDEVKKAKKAKKAEEVLKKLHKSSIYIEGMAEYKEQKEQADIMFQKIMNEINAGK